MNMKKITGILLAGIMTASLSLAGCGGGSTASSAAENSASASTAASSASESATSESAAAESTSSASEVSETEPETPAVEPASLKVGMLGKDIKTACIITASELGYFDEAGVDVSFETVADLATGITAVSEGTLDVLPYGAIPTCSFVSQGAEVAVFGGTISEGSECLTLPENADAYKTADDFRGKKIGCFRMETGHMIMKGYLRENGLDINSDCEFIYLDSQASIAEAVAKGEVDLGFVNSGYGFVARENGTAVAFHVGDFVSDFPCCRQSTSIADLNDPAKREALVRFEMAALRGYLTIQTDKQAAIDALVSYSGQSPEYVENVIYGTDGYDAAMIISLDPNKTKVCEFYELMKANGDIDASTPYTMEDHVDTGVYEEALNRLLAEGEHTDILEKLLADFAANNQ